jgi:hypothetical protein
MCVCLDHDPWHTAGSRRALRAMYSPDGPLNLLSVANFLRFGANGLQSACSAWWGTRMQSHIASKRGRLPDTATIERERSAAC